MDSLMSPGSKLNGLMVSAGFSDKLGSLVGAALDARVANNSGIAEHLLDAFSPLSGTELDQLISVGMAPLGFCSRPYQNYVSHFATASSQFNPAHFEKHIGSMLARCMNPQDASNVILNIANTLQNSGVNASALMIPNASFEAQIAQMLQGVMGQLQQAIQTKLNEMMPAPQVAGKKRKKKGGLKGKLKKGLKKVGKGFKKIGKMAKGVAKMGKAMFKGVIGSAKGLFKGNFLKNIFKLGGGLLGGLIGGPMGSSMIGQIASIGISKLMGKKKAAKLQDVFGQMSRMFQVVNTIHSGANQFNMQGLTKMIRA